MPSVWHVEELVACDVACCMRSCSLAVLLLLLLLVVACDAHALCMLHVSVACSRILSKWCDGCAVLSRCMCMYDLGNLQTTIHRCAALPLHLARSRDGQCTRTWRLKQKKEPIVANKG